MKKVERLFLTVLFLTLTLMAQAQKKEISAAKLNIKNGTNLEAAEKSIRALLTDSTNRQNPKLWLLLQGAVKKQYDVGNEKLYLKQQYDTAQLFIIAKKMFDILESFDSIDVQPDEKGRVLPKYRKKHAEFLDPYRQNIYTGGSFFIRKQKFQDAYNMFETYLECANQPLFESYDYANQDPRMPEAAYWATYSGFKLNKPQLVFRYADLARKDTAHVEYLLQYMSEAYFALGDTARCISILQEGLQAFPTNSYFTPRLVDYYCNEKMFDEALNIVDEAIQNHEDNWIYRFAKSTIFLNTGRLEECIALCDELIETNENLTDAFHNAGMAYYQLAQNKWKEIDGDRQRREEVLDLYRRALAYLERYRSLAPEASAKWAMPLYTIYLNLNMGTEFDEMEKIVYQLSGE
ncbi:MAG: hypothetical protein IJR71_00795 [Prevotella sp.]|nr:hypothetical protein [Prevotella sp.]